MQTPAEFVEEWQETLASHDVDAVVELYKDDAVLLGTVDKGVRKAVSYTHLTLPTNREV